MNLLLVIVFHQQFIMRLTGIRDSHASNINFVSLDKLSSLHSAAIENLLWMRSTIIFWFFLIYQLWMIPPMLVTISGSAAISIVFLQAPFKGNHFWLYVCRAFRYYSQKGFGIWFLFSLNNFIYMTNSDKKVKRLKPSMLLFFSQSIVQLVRIWWNAINWLLFY